MSDRSGEQHAVVDLTDDARDTRELLVRAAAEVFREKGYTGSRVQDIARRAGFTSGALYSHFDSRAELLAEAIAVENTAMLRRLSDGLGSSRAADAAEIAESVAGFVSLASSPTDQLLLDGFALCAREPDARDRIGGSLRTLLGQLEEQLGAMPMEPGSPVDDDPRGVAYLLVAFMSGVSALRAAGLGDTVPVDITSMLTRIMRELGALGELEPADAVAAASADGPG